MMTIEHLSFGYPKRKNRVFDDFSLKLREGNVYGLLGKNGAGKSTLLYLMTGLLTPQSGQACLHGVNVRLRRPDTLADFYLIPEEFDLPDYSLEKYVRLYAPFYPKFDHESLRRNLEAFDMTEDLKLGELSMGQKKKVLVCFALATHTSWLIMDEPTNGMDIPSKSQFRKLLIREMDEKRGIVISTHQVRDVENLLDHIVMIDDSRLLLDASYAGITAGLLFEERPLSDTTGEALYVQPSLYGNSVIVPNRTGSESVVNLEVLFNAVLADGDKIRAAIDASTNHNND